MQEPRRILDLSPTVGPGLVVYEGDPPPEIERAIDGAYVTSRLRMSAHTGTHVDAPAHVTRGGATVDRLPLDAFVGPARVAEAAGNAIDAAGVRALAPRRGERLLLKTRNSARAWAREPFRRDFVHITLDGAQELVRAGVRTVGIDYLSVERYGGDASTHQALFDGGVAVIEGLLLADVAPGEYFLACLPLKVEDGDGAPARAVLIEP